VPKRAQKVQRMTGINGLIVQEIRVFGKIGFLNRAQTCPKSTTDDGDKRIDCPRNPIFWKNRISQTMPKSAPKNSVQRMTGINGLIVQEIRFFGKIGFLNPAQTCPENSVQRMTGINGLIVQEIRFFGKIGFLNPAQKCPKNSVQRMTGINGLVRAVILSANTTDYT
jgi:RNase P/RNase MRP subunit p29